MAKLRKTQKLIGMALTFSLIIGIISALIVPVGAIPPPRNFAINRSMGTATLHTDSRDIYLNAGDWLGVDLRFTPTVPLPVVPSSIIFGVVNVSTGQFYSFQFYMGNPPQNTIKTNKILGVPVSGVYRFRVNNTLLVPVQVSGSFTFEKPTGTFCPGGGLANRNFTIQLMGATTTTSLWTGLINSARNAWNNSGSGVNITTTTAGPNQHTIEVDWYSGPNTDFLGRVIVRPPEYVVTTTSEILINTRTIGSTANFRQSVIAHEMGHLLWLGDNPAPSNPNSSIMNTTRDRETIRVPQVYDVHNVRFVYD
ncbi:MAG: hypothetical protein FWH07_08440 [Oscillospiraceae bacterium]|nr:hypothetical protein [Oscillospiraceae bacterium]